MRALIVIAVLYWLVAIGLAMLTGPLTLIAAGILFVIIYGTIWVTRT